MRAAIEIVNRADWHAAAGLCDPVSLVRFRRQLLEQLEPDATRFELTVEEYLRLSPDMPRAVAEYYVAQHRARTDPGQRLREELPEISDLDSLRSMSPEAVFASWLDGRSPRRQIERLAAESRITPNRATLPTEVANAMFPYIVIGAVADGQGVAHVLYRLDVTIGNPTNGEAEAWLARLPADERELAQDLSGREHPRVITCRKQTDGSWRLLAGYDFLGMGSTVVQTVEVAS